MSRKGPISSPDLRNQSISALQGRLFAAKRAQDVDLEIKMLFAIAERAIAEGNGGLANFHFKIAADVIRRSKHSLAKLCDAIGPRAEFLGSGDRLEEALVLAQQAVDAAREYAAPPAQARWIASLGSIQRRAKAPDAARRAFEEAREIYRGLGKDGLAGLADVEGKLGLLAHEAHDEQAAEAAYRRAAETAAAAGDKGLVLTWERNLARALMRRRCYHDAWEHFDRAMTVARTLGQENQVVDIAESWALSYSLAHRHKEAAAILLKSARDVRAPATRVYLLDASRNSLRQSQDWKRLEQTCRRIVAILERAGAPAEKIETFREEIVRTASRRAAKPATRIPRKPGEPTALDAYIVECMIYYQKQNNTAGMADMAHLMCDIAIGLADPGEAGWRELMQETQVRFRVVTDAIRALMDEDQPFRSLEIAQRFKCVGFCRPNLEYLSQTAPANEDAGKYLTAWRALQKAVADLRSATLDDVGLHFHAVRAAGEMLLEAGETLRESDRVLHARLGGLIRPNDLLNGLPLESPVAIVDLICGPEGTAVHILTRRGGVVPPDYFFSPLLTGKKIAELLELWHSHRVAHEISQRQYEALLQIGKTLHDEMFCALASQLAQQRITQIVFVPDSFLAPLPLHLASVCSKNVAEIVKAIQVARRPSEVSFLGEAFPVEYATCLQVIASSQYQKFPRKLSRVIALSDPLSDLPGARATAEWMADIAGSRGWLTSWSGPDATRANLLSGLKTADIVVIGTHGNFDITRPGRSRLVFADGDWTLTEMLDQRPLSRGVLAVLGACEIGSSTVLGDPREFSGIPGGLLSAGASAVLAPLWPVEDVSMGFLIERFIYHMSNRGLRPAAVLFRAQLDLKRMTKSQAMQRCDRLLKTVQRLPPSAERRRQVMNLDNLRDWIDGVEGRYPFVWPQFWGGLIVVGSGWHSPAGASVLNAATMEVHVWDLVQQQGSRELLGKGKFAEARKSLEELLPRLDGAQRADALDQLAWTVWNTRIAGAESAAEKETRVLLQEAETLARSDQDEQLLRNIAATRAKIALHRGGHERKQHVKTNIH